MIYVDQKQRHYNCLTKKIFDTQSHISFQSEFESAATRFSDNNSGLLKTSFVKKGSKFFPNSSIFLEVFWLEKRISWHHGRRKVHDYFLLILCKSSIWFTEKHIFKMIIYFFNTSKCAANYVISFEVYDAQWPNQLILVSFHYFDAPRAPRAPRGV